MEETSIEELKQKLSEAEKLRDEYLAGWQRCQADFINFRKDETERITWLKKQSDANWFLKVLAFYDDLELAQNHLPDDLRENGWLKANFAIQSKFLDDLKKDGLAEIKALGEKFNPEFHEAVGHIERVEGAGESEVVAEVVQRGYVLNGELLRPAKVKIIK